jgi:hypothetical protein
MRDNELPQNLWTQSNRLTNKPWNKDKYFVTGGRITISKLQTLVTVNLFTTKFPWQSAVEDWCPDEHWGVALAFLQKWCHT